MVTKATPRLQNGESLPQLEDWTKPGGYPEHIWP